MSLREALIELSVASPEEILDASARQELYGGDLITNLLDVRAVPETQALRALALSYQLPAGPAGEVPYAAGAAIAAVPRDLATSLGIYPFRLDGNQLGILASEPVSDEGLEMLRQTTGLGEIYVELVLAPRLRQAIARDYSLPLDRRSRKLIARLEGSELYHSSRAPDLLADAPSFSELPRPTSIVPVTFFGDWADLETPSHALFSAETAPQPQTAPRVRPSTASTARPNAPVPNLRPRDTERGPPTTSSPLSPRLQDPGKHRGPYTLTQAKQDLQRVTRADQILQVYFSFAAQYFDITACFTLHGKTAQLRSARGLPQGPSSAKAGPLSLDRHPALDTVIQTSNWLLTTLVTSDPELSATLGFNALVVSLLLPVRIRERVTLILLGAFESGDVELENAAELFSFEPFVSRALERLIAQRKALAGDASEFAETSPPPITMNFDGPQESDELVTLPPVTERR